MVMMVKGVVTLSDGGDGNGSIVEESRLGW